MPGKDQNGPEDIRDHDLDKAAGGKITEGMKKADVIAKVEIDLTATVNAPTGNLATKSRKA